MDEYRTEWLARARAGGAVLDAEAYRRGQYRLVLAEAPSEGIEFPDLAHAADYGIIHDFTTDYGPALAAAAEMADPVEVPRSLIKFQAPVRLADRGDATFLEWKDRCENGIWPPATPGMEVVPHTLEDGVHTAGLPADWVDRWMTEGLRNWCSPFDAAWFRELGVQPVLSIGPARREQGAVVFDCSVTMPTLTPEQREKMREFAASVFRSDPAVVFVAPGPEEDFTWVQEFQCDPGPRRLPFSGHSGEPE